MCIIKRGVWIGLILCIWASLKAEMAVVLLEETLTNPPAGWVYTGIKGTYADGGLKLEASGACVMTQIFDGVVTNLVIKTKGYQVSGSTSLEIIPSCDGLTWQSDKKQILSPTTTTTEQSFDFAVEDVFRVFKFVMQKDKGNIGLYAVTIHYAMGVLPPEVQPPWALEASERTPTSFTASWQAVAGCEHYLLDLYQIAVTGQVTATTVFEESFAGFSAGEPNAAAHSTDKASVLDELTTAPGWGGFKVYQAGGSIKVGTTTEQGWLRTPMLDLSDYGGEFELDFKACAWQGDATSFNVALIANGSTNWQAVVGGLDNSNYLFEEFHLAGDTGGAECQFFFQATKANRARFFLDELVVSQGGLAGAPLTNFIFTAREVTGVSTNLSGLTPGVYHYRVRAVSNAVISVFSNVVTLDTTLSDTPPWIEPLTAQSVRLGSVLTLPLTIIATDGDPVMDTKVVAHGSVAGSYALNEGVFSYTPLQSDLGVKIFSFTAQDKDGWSEDVTLEVQVLRQQIMALTMEAATGTYVQDFSLLAVGGAAAEWDNWAWPWPAWSAFVNHDPVSTYRTGSGASANGGIYLWGEADNYTLGSLAASAKTYTYGVALSNATGEAITQLEIKFTASQWRVANTNAQILECSYCVADTALPLTEGEWRHLEALNFVSPLVLEGEQASGAVYAEEVLVGCLPRPLAQDAVLNLRWRDVDDSGSDHGLGIDDLVLSWASGVMPTAIAVPWQGTLETFNEMGSAATSALPWMWRIETRDDAPRQIGSYAMAHERTSLAMTKQDFTACGCYNFSAATAYDQAVGGLPGDTKAKSITLFGKFYNATDVKVHHWAVKYDLEKYRNGTVATEVQLLCSVDGDTWNEVGPAVVWEDDDDILGYPLAMRPKIVRPCEGMVDFATPIAVGDTFYLAWRISVAADVALDGAQALAIDNVSIKPAVSWGMLFILK